MAVNETTGTERYVVNITFRNFEINERIPEE